MISRFIGIPVLLLAAAAAFAGAAQAQSLSRSERAAVAAATRAKTPADRIRTDVVWISADARRGRDTGTREYQDAARYAAGRFSAVGLARAIEDDWFHRTPLRRAVRDPAAQSLSILRDGAAAQFTSGDDFIIRGAPVEHFEVTGAAVFVGYGVADPQSGYDDFAGVDLKGKFAVVFNGAPRGLDTEKKAHHANFSNKVRTVAERGGVGVILLPTKKSEDGNDWSRTAAYSGRPALYWVRPDGVAETPSDRIEAGAQLSPDGARKLFEGAAATLEDVQAIESGSDWPQFLPFEFAGDVTIGGTARLHEMSSPNVVGVIPGADPALRDEVVVVTAHLDGVGLAQSGRDRIRNGAVDNALGVATMIEAARTLAGETPPARTIAFVALTGEERGLLGAGHFAQHPPAGLENMVANVNLDMPVVLFPFTDVVAFGAERSTLGPIVRDALAETGVKLSPDPLPEENLFTRSDHYRFVEQGVPSVFLCVGFENGGEFAFRNFLSDHYHKPSDDIFLPIDYESAARFADVNARIVRAIANAEDRPRWNEGDFFGDLFGKP